jgi:hypothetical protein
MHNLNIYGARAIHGQHHTYKTHHSLDLGEAITFPLIVYYVPLHEAHNQITFCLETPKVGTPSTLGPHNFVYKPSITMRSKAKL